MPPKSKTNALRCPACNHSIKTAFNANLHPLLKVLVCRKCYLLYGTGDFAGEFEGGVDENGDDNFCRLCVDGGELYFCANSSDSFRCHYAFCRDCIEKINPQDPLVNDELSENDKWKCLACDGTKTANARREAQETLQRLNIEDLERNVIVEEVSGSAIKKRKQESPEIMSPKSYPSIDLAPLIAKEKPKPAPEIRTSAPTSEPAASKAPSSAPSEKLGSLNTSENQPKKADNSKQEKPAPTTPKPKAVHMSEKPVPTTEKSKNSKAEVTQQREPEAISMPPVEKPKPPKTSLRNLGGPRSSPSSAMNSLTASSRDESSNKPARPASDNRPLLKQNQSIRSEPVTSKRLKVSKNTVESCILLSEPELKNRLREYEIHKDNHIKRVNQHFDSILKHFDTLLHSKADDDLMRSHIDSMRGSIQDINKMFSDLEKLWEMREKKV